MVPRHVHPLPAIGTEIQMLPRFHLQVRGDKVHDVVTSAAPTIMHMESAMTKEVAEWCDLLPRMQPLNGEGWPAVTPNIPNCQIIGFIPDVHVMAYIHGVRRQALSTFFIYQSFVENVHIYTGQQLMGALGLQIRFRHPGSPIMMIY